MNFNEIYIGQKEHILHNITEIDVENFVKLTGDNNKLHVDSEYAKTTSFKNRVVHGMLGASFISTVIGTKLPGNGALWFSQTLEFILPLRINDIIKVEVEVIEKRERDESIKLQTCIYNQNKQLITSGIAWVKIIKEELMEKNENSIQKVALVFGATGGIGSATCNELAENGFNVAINYNNNTKEALHINEYVNTLTKSIIIKGNILTDIEKIVDQTIKEFGRIDAVINCVSSPIPNISFLNMEHNDFETHLNTHLYTNINIAKLVIPYMIKQGYGKIVHIGSSLADKPNFELSAYVTAKNALWGFTKAMSHEYAPKGIRVNMVTPSLVDTNLTSNISEKNKLVMAAQSSLRRNAYASDIAKVIVFLISDKSDYITGQNIRVNGGIYG